MSADNQQERQDWNNLTTKIDSLAIKLKVKISGFNARIKTTGGEQRVYLEEEIAPYQLLRTDLLSMAKVIREKYPISESSETER